MSIIKLTTRIKAPLQTCFNLSRSVDVHLQSMQAQQERVVAGVTSGLMQLNETVTWRARHFGICFMMEVQITELQFPAFFADQMVSGPFKMMRHYHYFKPDGAGTVMTDEFVFRSPLGWLGKAVNRLVLKSYLKKLLQQRNLTIKQLAETKTHNKHEHNLSTSNLNPAA
jgi:ligand-binding SRPBCC domain-containing protein